MRAIWKGAISFGLVNVPVKLYAATGDHDIRFHQVHREDGGRIRYRRTCSVCGEDVEYADIAKGYEAPDGQLVILTDEDLDTLPVASGHEIDVVEFVPSEQIDPILYAKSYFLEPEARGTKPYALLRAALEESDRMAVVKIALRQRETLAVLRVREDAILLQTMLWPDEVRTPQLQNLDADIELRPQELKMAASLIDSMVADFDPEEFTDSYREAVQAMVDDKLDSGSSKKAPETKETADDSGGEVIDLLTALQRSVDRAKAGAAADGDSAAPAKKAAAKKAPAKKAAAKKALPKKAVAKKAPTKKAAAKKSA